MAEYANVPVQTVAADQHVLYAAEVIKGTPCIYHRSGSGMVTLKGIGSQMKARFRVHFDGNVAIPAGSAITPISLSIAIGGEPLMTATAITTPVAVSTYFNVSTEAIVEVPKGCCATVSVMNTGTGDVEITNANMIVEREM